MEDAKRLGPGSHLQPGPTLSTNGDDTMPSQHLQEGVVPPSPSKAVNSSDASPPSGDESQQQLNAPQQSFEMVVSKQLSAETQPSEQQQLRPVDNQHQPLSRKSSSPLTVTQPQQNVDEDSVDQTHPKPNQSPPAPAQAAVEAVSSQVPVQQGQQLPMELRTPQPIYPNQTGVPDQGMMQGMPMIGTYGMMPMYTSQGNVVFMPVATQAGAPGMYMHQQATQVFMQQQMPMQQPLQQQLQQQPLQQQQLQQQPPFQQQQQPMMQQQQPAMQQLQQIPPMMQQQIPIQQQQQQQPPPSSQDQVLPQVQQQSTQLTQQGGQQAQIPSQQLQQVQPPQPGQQVATSLQGQTLTQPQQSQTTAAPSNVAPIQSVPGGTQPQQSQGKHARVTIQDLAEKLSNISQLHKKPTQPAKAATSQGQPPTSLQQQVLHGQGLAGQTNIPYHNQVSVSVAQQTTQSNSQSSANIVLTPQPVPNMLAPVFHPIQDERKASLMETQSLPIHSFLPRPASEPVPDMPTPVVDSQQETYIVTEKADEYQIQNEQPVRPVSPKPPSSPTKKSRFLVSSVEEKKDAAAVTEEKPKEETSEGETGNQKDTVEDKSSKETIVGSAKDQAPVQKEEKKKGRFTVAPTPSTVKDAVQNDQVKSGETAMQAKEVKDVVSHLVTQTEKNIDKEGGGVANTVKPSAAAPAKLGRFQVNKVSDKAPVMEEKPSFQQSVPETVPAQSSKDDPTPVEMENEKQEAEQLPPQSATASLVMKEADREPSPQRGNDPVLDIPIGPAIRPERKSSLIGSERDTPDSIASDGSSLPPLPPEGPTLQPSGSLLGQSFQPVQGVFSKPESQSTPPLSDVGSASPGLLAATDLGPVQPPQAEAVRDLQELLKRQEEERNKILQKQHSEMQEFIAQYPQTTPPQSPLLLYQPNMYSMVPFPMQENFAPQGMWHPSSIPIPFNHFQGVPFSHGPGSAFGGFRQSNTSPPTVPGMSSIGVPVQGPGGIVTYRPVASVEMPGQGAMPGAAPAMTGAQYQVPTTMHPHFSGSNEMIQQQSYAGNQGLKRSVSYQSVVPQANAAAFQPAFFSNPNQAMGTPNPEAFMPRPGAVWMNPASGVQIVDMKDQQSMQNGINRSPEQLPRGVDNTGVAFPTQHVHSHPSHVRTGSGTEKIDLTKRVIPMNSEASEVVTSKGYQARTDPSQVERRLEEARPGGLNQSNNQSENVELHGQSENRVAVDHPTTDPNRPADYNTNVIPTDQNVAAQLQTSASLQQQQQQNAGKRKGTFADDKFKNLADLSKPTTRPALDERKVSLNDLKRAQQQHDLQASAARQPSGTTKADVPKT
ncbi:daxx-like protein [Lytechinus pictus]|uniref:daxx-like protein n=1 Tax=Lytechinus pictus TaxID=7653 RepID=UPI0030BA07AC